MSKQPLFSFECCIRFLLGWSGQKSNVSLPKKPINQFLTSSDKADNRCFELTILVYNTMLKGQTLSPGFIDPHLHPSMAAFILTMNFITPFDWNFPWSKSTTKGVRSQNEYR